MHFVEGPVTKYIIVLLYLKIIPWARVGYEMIDSQWAM